MFLTTWVLCCLYHWSQISIKDFFFRNMKQTAIHQSLKISYAQLQKTAAQSHEAGASTLTIKTSLTKKQLRWVWKRFWVKERFESGRRIFTQLSAFIKQLLWKTSIQWIYIRSQTLMKGLHQLQGLQRWRKPIKEVIVL